MRVRFIVLLAAFFVLTYVGYSQLAAQNIVTCPGLVQKAISSIGNNCGGLNRNSACYGFTDVQASFSVPQPANYFSRPSDRAGLADLQDLNTSPMDQTNDKWGIALMSMQANLPDTLPGQNVVFMLLGDTQIENAVPSDQLAQPGKTVSVALQIAGDLYYQPDFNAKKVGTVPQGTALTADAISTDGQWVRVAYGGIPGWLTKQVITTSGDLTTLSVIGPDTKTPVQAFYFRTGISGTDCTEAPNALVVQGPKNLTVDIQANGADIQLGSTIVLYLLPVDGITQQYLTDHFGDIGVVSQLMQIIVLDGHVIINPGTANPIDLTTGQTSFTCLTNPQNLGDDGQANDRTVFNQCLWAPPRNVTVDDIAPFRDIEGLPLNYPIELPVELPTLTPSPTLIPSDTFTPRPTRTPTPIGTLVAPTDTPTDTPQPQQPPPQQPTHNNPPPTATFTPTVCDPFTFPANINGADIASLIAAINAANDEVCHPGTQAINLNGTYSFTGANNTNANGQNALPIITSGIIIDGGGGSTLQGQDPYSGRLFEIGASGNLVLRRIVLTGGGQGGGIVNGGLIYNSGALSATNTTFSNSNASASGGALYNAGSATLIQTTFSNNSAATTGGGIENAGTLSLLNSTIANNNASVDGSGIESGGGLTMDFTTVAFNGGSSGGGVAISGGSAAAQNSIVAGNTGRDCNGGAVNNPSDPNAENFDSDGTCEFGGTVDSGSLGSLQNNGGPTNTVALTVSSSAIDSVDCLTSSGANVPIDQRGITRPQDLTYNQNTCDAGAFELEAQGPG